MAKKLSETAKILTITRQPSTFLDDKSIAMQLTRNLKFQNPKSKSRGHHTEFWTL